MYANHNKSQIIYSILQKKSALAFKLYKTIKFYFVLPVSYKI